MPKSLGVQFAAEIAEQPAVWRRLADGDLARRLAEEIGDEVVLIGSGSSLFAAELGALALRRRNIRAHALAATEARLDHRIYERKTVVAISQSGRSSDVLDALDVLHPRCLVALTNTPDSPLSARANTSIDIGAGHEGAIPASKSVTATVALLLWAASLVGGSDARNGPVLARTADAVESWLRSEGAGAVAEAAATIATRRSAAVLGSSYGLPIARETALKCKEAAYLHAEGFAAGEFRHGSVAMVDRSFCAIGIVDEISLPTLTRPMHEVVSAGALCYTIGSARIDGIPALGPDVDEPYNTLAWLVTAQLLALFAARARGIDSDAPRGLTKAVIGRR